MKKLTALVLAGMLCLGMSVTAFAADSVTTEDAGAVIVDGNGDPVELEVGALDTKEAETVAAWKENPETLKEAVEEAVKGTNITLKENAEYVVLDAFEYSIPEGTTLTEGEPITIGFDVSGLLPDGLKEGETLYLLHGVKDADGNTNWVLVETTVEDGVAVAELDSLSPIAFVLASDGTPIVNPDPIIPTPDNPNDSNNSNNSITVDELVNLIIDRLQAREVTVTRTVVSNRVSPKTGE